MAIKSRETLQNEFSVVHQKMPIEVLGYDIDLETIHETNIDCHGTLKPTVYIGESIKGVRIPYDILKPWL